VHVGILEDKKISLCTVHRNEMCCACLWGSYISIIRKQYLSTIEINTQAEEEIERGRMNRHSLII
jgi:hypothetical protein